MPHPGKFILAGLDGVVPNAHLKFSPDQGYFEMHVPFLINNGYIQKFNSEILKSLVQQFVGAGSPFSWAIVDCAEFEGRELDFFKYKLVIYLASAESIEMDKLLAFLAMHKEATADLYENLFELGSLAYPAEPFVQSIWGQPLISPINLTQEQQAAFFGKPSEDSGMSQTA